ncbi:MAG: CPBP family intramembrane metalloprotease [Oscillospiraceae bacterium]|nr:CPBP family intramembrane metalloprotease [Oscillospiraceae bacterium]
MTKLREKSEIWFAVIWIIAYVVIFSVCDSVSEQIGLVKSVTLAVCVLLSIIIFAFVKKNGFMEYYGLCKGEYDVKKWLYFIPVVLMSTTNFWFGLQLNRSVLESILYAASMIFVGFLEEVIFRGFLFKAMSKDNMKSAIIVSSITFGMGHIVNLLNGSAFLPTMLQIIYAVAIGFMFTIIFVKSGSILPCIISHIVVNTSSTFSGDRGTVEAIITCVFITVVSFGYGYYLMKKIPDRVAE